MTASRVLVSYQSTVFVTVSGLFSGVDLWSITSYTTFNAHYINIHAAALLDLGLVDK